MFGPFFHPRPFGRGRANVEATVRVQAPAPIELGHRLLVDTPVGKLPDLMVAAPTLLAPLALEFTVAYRLGEYLSFVQALMRSEFARRQKLKGKPFKGVGWLARASLVLIATPMFFYKKWRVGVCHFRIDEAGVERHSKQGAYLTPWSKVRAVHRYKPGYLLSMDKSAMALPLRCMDAAQRAQMVTLIERHGPASLG